jgi:uncharacterized iron-regulated membrane protein
VKSFRTVVFWLHLAAGVTAGVVILVMSVTGAALALKPQILAAVDARVRLVSPPSATTPRLGVDRLLASVKAARPAAQPTGLTLLADRTASASIQLGRDGTVYVDPYSGQFLGEGSSRAQSFFRTAEDWHRWLGVSGDRRTTARSINDAANVAFLVLALSGPYLWWPRSWTWSNVRAVLWFRRARTARARDFNWHNVIGLWCSPILIVLTLTGVVMSYPWANSLLYRLAGSPPPVAAGGGPGGAAREGGPAHTPRGPQSLDRAWASAEARVPAWRSITVRPPNRPGAPVAFTIVDGRSWNVFARSQLTVDAASGAGIRWEPYDDTSRGQKARLFVRFSHTGEIGGIVAQTIAGIACIGGAFLVWTGLALACRRVLGSRMLLDRVRARVVQP